MDLLDDKNLHDCLKLVPDHDLVEQAYIEGKITDTELRSVQLPSDIITALRVEKDV